MTKLKQINFNNTERRYKSRTFKQIKNIEEKNKKQLKEIKYKQEGNQIYLMSKEKTIKSSLINKKSN